MSRSVSVNRIEKKAHHLAFAAAAGCAMWLVSPAARANPRPLPFTYPYETLPEGAAELELYNDMNPLRVNADPNDPSMGRLWEPQYKLQAEFEYGITDRWELGLYQVFEANPEDGGNNHLTFDGFKWRIRTRLAEAGELPVDIGFYLELETLHDEWALEEKILLQRRFGRLRWMGNIWIEEEYERPFDAAKRSDLELIVNPATGFTYEVTRTFHPGIEYWARGQISPEGETDLDRKNNMVHHYVGPTTHLNFGKLWLSLGLYAHLNDISKPQPGEAYGPFWFRSVLGLDL
jgi:hypothetical protein